MKIIYQTMINYNLYRIIQNDSNGELYVQVELVGCGTYVTISSNSESQTRRDNYCKVIIEAINLNVIKLVSVK